MLTDESPLLTGEYKDSIGRAISYKTANHTWNRLLRKIGAEQRSRRFRVYHAHVLRKFFRTNCAYARVPTEIVHKWMGRVGYLEREYLRLNAERELKLYRKAEPHLTISEVEELKRNLHRRVKEEVQKCLADPAVVARMIAEFKKHLTGDSNNPGMFG